MRLLCGFHQVSIVEMESLEGGGAGGGGGSLGRGLQRDSGEGGRQQEAEPRVSPDAFWRRVDADSSTMKNFLPRAFVLPQSLQTQYRGSHNILP